MDQNGKNSKKLKNGKKLWKTGKLWKIVKNGKKFVLKNREKRRKWWKTEGEKIVS